jgi:Protein of unknown function (DUF2934)
MATKRVSPKNTKRKAAAAPAVDPVVRRSLIAAEAYFLAERRGFAPGSELADWVAAETAVDSRFERQEALG